MIWTEPVTVPSSSTSIETSGSCSESRETNLLQSGQRAMVILLTSGD